MSTRQFTFTVASTDVPAWVPTTVGVIAEAAMTNTLDSVSNLAGSTWAGNSNSKLQDFSGGVFNQHYSPHGALIVHGGGHSANNDNGVYIADMTTLTWSKPKPSTELNSYVPTRWKNYGFGNGTSYDYFVQNGPNSTAWDTVAIWNDTTGADLPNDRMVNPREYYENEPGSAHTYDSLVILPYQVGGAGPQGAMVRVQSSAVGAVSGGSVGVTAFSHMFDFQSLTWSRFTSTGWGNDAATNDAGVYADRTAHGGGYELWRIPKFNRAHIAKLDCTSKVGTAVAGMQTVTGDSDSANVVAYHKLRDIIVQVGSPVASSVTATTPALFYYMNLSAESNVGFRNFVANWVDAGGAPTTAPIHGLYGENTIIYLEELDKFFYFTKRATDRYYLITVPANLSDPWRVEIQPITGTVTNGGTPPTPVDWAYQSQVFPLSFEPATYMYHRMDYAPALKSVVWASGRGGANPWGGRIFAIRVVP